MGNYQTECVILFLIILATGLTFLDLLGPKFKGERLRFLVSSASNCRIANVRDNRKRLKNGRWADVEVDTTSNKKLSLGIRLRHS